MSDNFNVDTSSVDLEAEIKAAEQREKDFLQVPTTKEGDPAQPEAEPKVKPEAVPDEFWNAETGEVDWAKLNERLKSGEKTDDKAEQPEETCETINGVALTTKHAEDFAPFYEQFGKDGTVSDDAVKYVKDTFGIDASKDMIGAYMAGKMNAVNAGQVEATNAVRAEVFAVTGGEAKYAELQAWLGDTLTDEQKAEYNAAVEGGDKRLAKLAVEAAWNRYRAEGTFDPQTTVGKGRTLGKATDAYSSIDEMVKDTSNPKYERDPDFRAKVEAKIARSGNIAVPSY